MLKINGLFSWGTSEILNISWNALDICFIKTWFIINFCSDWKCITVNDICQTLESRGLKRKRLTRFRQRGEFARSHPKSVVCNKIISYKSWYKNNTLQNASWFQRCVCKLNKPTWYLKTLSDKRTNLYFRWISRVRFIVWTLYATKKITVITVMYS